MRRKARRDANKKARIMNKKDDEEEKEFDLPWFCTLFYLKIFFVFLLVLLITLLVLSLRLLLSIDKKSCGLAQRDGGDHYIYQAGNHFFSQVEHIDIFHADPARDKELLRTRDKAFLDKVKRTHASAFREKNNTTLNSFEYRIHRNISFRTEEPISSMIYNGSLLFHSDCPLRLYRTLMSSASILLNFHHVFFLEKLKSLQK